MEDHDLGHMVVKSYFIVDESLLKKHNVINTADKKTQLHFQLTFISMLLIIF